MHPPIQRIGLTGGIGSGKSTVAGMLVARGAALIDADAISRQLTAPGGAAIGELASQFGPQAITAEGAMDRDRMRQLAFSDPGIKVQLEAIIHPLVSQESIRQARAAVQAGRACILFDIPLLVESGRWRQHHRQYPDRPIGRCNHADGGQPHRYPGRRTRGERADRVRRWRCADGQSRRFLHRSQRDHGQLSLVRHQIGRAHV